jgi:hypothetical protein
VDTTDQWAIHHHITGGFSPYGDWLYKRVKERTTIYGLGHLIATLSDLRIS